MYFWIPFQLRVGQDRSSSTWWAPVCSKPCWHRKEPLNPTLHRCLQNPLPSCWYVFCKLLYFIPHNLENVFSLLPLSVHNCAGDRGARDVAHTCYNMCVWRSRTAFRDQLSSSTEGLNSNINKTLCSEFKTRRFGEMAQLVKCLPYKHEDLSSDPQYIYKKFGPKI